MRYTVMGIWKVTGQPTTISIEATDKDAANDVALRRGVEVQRIEKAKPVSPHIGVTHEEMEYARYVVSSRTSIGKILFGLLLVGLGLGATWYSYNVATQAHSTGHYTVYWGLVIFGLYTAFRGAASQDHHHD